MNAACVFATLAALFAPWAVLARRGALGFFESRQAREAVDDTEEDAEAGEGREGGEGDDDRDRDRDDRDDRDGDGVLLREPLLRRPASAADDSVAPDSPPPLPGQTRHDVTLGRSFVLIEMWLLFFAIMFSSGAAMTLVNNLEAINASVRSPPSRAAALVSVFSVANCLGRLLGGAASERALRGPLGMARPHALAVAAALVGAGVLAPVVSPGPGGVFVAVAVVGASLGAHWGILPVICAEIFGEKATGAVYGWLSVSPVLGSYVLSVRVFGGLYDRASAAAGAGAGGACVGGGGAFGRRLRFARSRRRRRRRSRRGSARGPRGCTNGTRGGSARRARSERSRGRGERAGGARRGTREPEGCTRTGRRGRNRARGEASLVIRENDETCPSLLFTLVVVDSRAHLTRTPPGRAVGPGFASPVLERGGDASLRGAVAAPTRRTAPRARSGPWETHPAGRRRPRVVVHGRRARGLGRARRARRSRARARGGRPVHRAFARVLGVALAGGVPRVPPRRRVADVARRTGGQVRRVGAGGGARGRGVLREPAIPRRARPARRRVSPRAVPRARRGNPRPARDGASQARPGRGARERALDRAAREVARRASARGGARVRSRASNPRRRRVNDGVRRGTRARRTTRTVERGGVPGPNPRGGIPPARRRPPRARRPRARPRGRPLGGGSAPARLGGERRRANARGRHPTRETFENFESGAFAPSPRVERALGFSRAARRTRPVSVRLRVRRGSVSFLRDRFRRLRDARASRRRRHPGRSRARVHARRRARAPAGGAARASRRSGSASASRAAGARSARVLRRAMPRRGRARGARRRARVRRRRRRTTSARFADDSAR